LTHEDLEHAKAGWEERVGPRYTLSVGVIGHQLPATMDPDRPLGAIVKAKVDLLLTVFALGEGDQPVVIFEEACPYDREALMASVRALSAHLLERG
jgi:hypothetical protein